MVGKPVTVPETVTIAQAARVITDNKVSGVIVVDTDGRAVGMLSELDCLRSLLSEIYNGQTLGGDSVVDVMTAPVTDAAPDDDIISVAESMLSNKQRRRPVVNQGSLVGQITCRQLLGALLDY
ncbi:MAG: CBS domain-containing protein [Gammaproteobacteria bacterium TMED182]|nr:protein-inosine monophosphate dehydrogenase [Gammaproteobacteria bacterium]RPG47977.1 MAG: CBS domain-containing protein [Gammaproteobacteria bacterium TMED182]